MSRLPVTLVCCLVGCLTVLGSAAGDTVPCKIGRYSQEAAVHYGLEDGLPSLDVRAIALVDGTLLAETADGAARLEDGQWRTAPGERAGAMAAIEIPASLQTLASAVREIVSDRVTGRRIAATNSGLYGENTKDRWERIEAVDPDGLRWDMGEVLVVVFDVKDRLWFGVKAGVACRDGETWRFYRGGDGLPYNEFTCAAAGPDGEVWFGTTKGVIRFNREEWAYRQGKRWLPDDSVRDIAVDERGNVWCATAKGVGCIEQRMMTLAEKAAFYEEEMDLIRRTEYGYVSEVGLKASGDKSAVVYNDSDNDGLWTSMYGAGECYAYAATRDAKAKDRAKRAFEALRFLQKVTQGAEHSPPHGYVARTIRSIDDPDPNIGRVEGDIEQRDLRDAYWKVYEPRWPKSADGKWYFKTDTSSDELDGHYFFYPLYYDLVAETEEEKARVREVVRDLTNHLVDNGFYLIDHDGNPTRWAVYGPKSVNTDLYWFPERGLNSLSILSYLTVAEHVTGDAKFGEAMRSLVEEHGYLQNLMFPKLQFGFGAGNQSDDEMAFMSFYNLIRYTKDEQVRMWANYSCYMYWTLEYPEMNPFFNFAYAAHGRGSKVTDLWGTFPLSPWRGWLDDSMKTLKGFPLDRCNWAHENSHRLDVVRLPRQQASDPYFPGRHDRGLLANGKVLPVENRHFGHWNTDPWELDYGGNGHELASGTVFLLPYYMGLYHGFIEETE